MPRRSFSPCLAPSRALLLLTTDPQHPQRINVTNEICQAARRSQTRASRRDGEPAPRLRRHARHSGSLGSRLPSLYLLGDQVFRKGTAHSRSDTKVQIARPRPTACRVSTRCNVLSIDDTKYFMYGGGGGSRTRVRNPSQQRDSMRSLFDWSHARRLRTDKMRRTPARRSRSANPGIAGRTSLLYDVLLPLTGEAVADGCLFN